MRQSRIQNFRPDLEYILALSVSPASTAQRNPVSMMHTVTIHEGTGRVGLSGSITISREKTGKEKFSDDE